MLLMSILTDVTAECHVRNILAQPQITMVITLLFTSVLFMPLPIYVKLLNLRIWEHASFHV